eukprot:7384636-Prymnesium_polylepis.2
MLGRLRSHAQRGRGSARRETGGSAHVAPAGSFALLDQVKAVLLFETPHHVLGQREFDEGLGGVRLARRAEQLLDPRPVGGGELGAR